MTAINTPADLARAIDHTVLKPEASVQQVDRLVGEALDHHFKAVCVSPVWVPHVTPLLRGTDVACCTVAGFPSGTSRPSIKAAEAAQSVREGADEVDIVAFLPALAELDLELARAELIEFSRACRAIRTDVVLKVIVESAYLLSLGPERGEAALAIACKAVRDSGCDFIKTSTGFHPTGGASVAAITLMKKHGTGLKIKASGGIRDWATAHACIDAGADRLGTSASVAIVAEMRQAAPTVRQHVR